METKPFNFESAKAGAEDKEAIPMDSPIGTK